MCIQVSRNVSFMQKLAKRILFIPVIVISEHFVSYFITSWLLHFPFLSVTFDETPAIKEVEMVETEDAKPADIPVIELIVEKENCWPEENKTDTAVWDNWLLRWFRDDGKNSWILIQLDI